MNSSTSTESYPHGPIPALLQMKGKLVVGIHSDPLIATRPDKPPNTHNGRTNHCWHHWQGGIGNGPFDCSVSLQPVVELRP